MRPYYIHDGSKFIDFNSVDHLEKHPESGKTMVVTKAGNRFSIDHMFEDIVIAMKRGLYGEAR